MFLGSYNDPFGSNKPVRIKNELIDDSAYVEVVQKTQVACVDVVPIVGDDRAFYLAKRSVYPMKGVWWLGGRIRFNDQSFQGAIARAIKRETGVKFSKHRFKPLGVSMYAWERVKQGDFPGKNVAITFALSVNRRELDRMSRGLDEKEYDTGFGFQRFDRERMTFENVHPVITDLFDALFGH